MKRRSFIQSLMAIPIVAGVAKLTFPQTSQMVREKDALVQSVYKGFTLRWSGWIGNVNRPYYAGHWVGINKQTGVNVYASYPGSQGQFSKGNAFDITRIFPQIEIGIDTSAQEKEEARMECLTRLIQAIDDLRPGLAETWPREQYLQVRALAGIRKGQLLRVSQFEDGVLPIDDLGGGWFVGVAMHDAMKGDMVKVGTEGKFPVRFGTFWLTTSQ